MIESRVGDFTRRVEFTPAYDNRHADPSESYGIGAMILRFVLIGTHGAMQFVCSTGMYPRHVLREWKGKGYDHGGGDGYDIGYHARVPQYEGHSRCEEPCEYVGGGPCYYDGTSLGASEFFPTFLIEGDDAVWAMLESRYRDRFASSETP